MVTGMAAKTPAGHDAHGPIGKRGNDPAILREHEARKREDAALKAAKDAEDNVHPNGLGHCGR